MGVGVIDPSQLPPDEREALWRHLVSKVSREGPCWHWTAATNSTGMPVVHWRGRALNARRWCYALATGRLLAVRLFVCPRDPQCIHPTHQRPTFTPAELEDLQTVYRQGASLRSLVQRTGRTLSTLRRVLARQDPLHQLSRPADGDQAGALGAGTRSGAARACAPAAVSRPGMYPPRLPVPGASARHLRTQAPPPPTDRDAERAYPGVVS